MASPIDRGFALSSSTAEFLSPISDALILYVVAQHAAASISGAEILGLAASVIQIAELGGKLSVKIFTFTRKVKNANKTIDALSQEIAVTGAVLQQLGQTLSNDASVKVCSQEAIDTAKKLVSDTEKVFKSLETLLDSDEKSSSKFRKAVNLRRLKFPFLESEIEEVQANLERLKSSLLVILNVLIFAEQLRNRETLPILEDQRDLLRTLAAEKDANEQRYERILKAIADRPNLVVDGPNKGSNVSGGSFDANSINSTTLTLINTADNASQRSVSPIQPTIRRTVDLPLIDLPEGLKHHHERIHNHTQLVQNLLAEIDCLEYKLDHGVRGRLQTGVLDVHWKEWEVQRSYFGSDSLQKMLASSSRVATYWVDKRAEEDHQEMLTRHRTPANQHTRPAFGSQRAQSAMLKIEGHAVMADGHTEADDPAIPAENSLPAVASGLPPLDVDQQSSQIVSMISEARKREAERHKQSKNYEKENAPGSLRVPTKAHESHRVTAPPSDLSEVDSMEFAHRESTEPGPHDEVAKAYGHISATKPRESIGQTSGPDFLKSAFAEGGKRISSETPRPDQSRGYMNTLETQKETKDNWKLAWQPQKPASRWEPSPSGSLFGQSSGLEPAISTIPGDKQPQNPFHTLPVPAPQRENEKGAETGKPSARFGARPDQTALRFSSDADDTFGHEPVIRDVQARRNTYIARPTTSRQQSRRPQNIGEPKIKKQVNKMQREEPRTRVQHRENLPVNDSVDDLLMKYTNISPQEIEEAWRTQGPPTSPLRTKIGVDSMSRDYSDDNDDEDNDVLQDSWENAEATSSNGRGIPFDF